MSVYSKIPIRKPARNAFNLSHTFRGCLNIGEIKPIARPLEAVPGDTFISGNISKVELSPIISNFYGELYFETWQFFVSNDMLYLTSDSGKFTDILASLQDPQNLLNLPYIPTANFFNNPSSWQSYLYGAYLSGSSSITSKHLVTYPLRAFTKIYNEWFKDENLQSDLLTNAPVAYINYKKDRYSSAFLTTQKGNAIRFLTSGSLSVGTVQNIFNGDTNSGYGVSLTGDSSSGDAPFYTSADATSLRYMSSANLYRAIANSMSVSLDGITINDLRLYNKLQKWQERNQLCGTRIKEYLLSNYGITPNDETLQRPVLIGHTKVPVIVDPIISNIQKDNVTSSSSLTINQELQNYQGSKSGVAGASSSFKYGKWLCKEFGWIITLGALRPKASYYQGVHKSLRKDSIVDYFNPIFEHLGQQEIKTSELYFSNTSTDDDIFGFQDIYNEMRHMEDFTAPDLATIFPNKTMNRKFANAPTLGSSFIQVLPTEYDYLFAVPSTRAPQAFFTSNNIVKAIRPLSKRSTPSL